MLAVGVVLKKVVWGWVHKWRLNGSCNEGVKWCLLR